MSQFEYKLALRPGEEASDFVWSIDKPDASFVGSTEYSIVTIRFANDRPAFITVKVTFKSDGKEWCGDRTISLVQVIVGQDPPWTLGKANHVDGIGGPFLVNPPSPPAVPQWITEHVPGSDCAAFTYNGTEKAPEPAIGIGSGISGITSAINWSVSFRLLSPPERPAAQQQIEFGCIQTAAQNAQLQYDTAPPGGQRMGVVARYISHDWLRVKCSPAGEPYPWYTRYGRGTGEGECEHTLRMSDTPKIVLPTQYDPLSPADPNALAPLMSATAVWGFNFHCCVRTRDLISEADKFYWVIKWRLWQVNFVYPVVDDADIVTFEPNWREVTSPTDVQIDIVPTIVNIMAPFGRYEHI